MGPGRPVAMGRSKLIRIVDRILDRKHALSRPHADVRSDGGVVSFTFDDFPASALHSGGTILEEAGWHGTYYSCAGLLGSESSVGRIATYDELLECLSRGHEIANHTLSHCDCREASGQQIVAELRDNESALGHLTRNFAFPYGAANVREQRLVQPLVTTARSVLHGVNGADTDRLNLRANPIYSSKGIAPLVEMIRAAAENGGWLILYTHDVVVDPSPFGCSPDEFRAIVAAVAASGMDVATVEQARLRFYLGDATAAGGV